MNAAMAPESARRSPQPNARTTFPLQAGIKPTSERPRFTLSRIEAHYAEERVRFLLCTLGPLQGHTVAISLNQQVATIAPESCIQMSITIFQHFGHGTSNLRLNRLAPLLAHALRIPIRSRALGHF